VFNIVNIYQLLEV